MTHVNFNRPVISLLVLAGLLMSGCSEAPKENLSAIEDVSSGVNYYNPQTGHNNLKFKPAHQVNAQYDTVWERLFSLYALPEVQHPRIDRAVNWYLQHPASLAIIQQRAEPYLYLILDEIEAKGMPGELALLPVVESAFVPDAYSKADASGLWQFVPGTGEDYGLEQNEWYDGRRDIYASTQAATTYLKELSEMFDGDWLLALASYNCGQNKVKRTIEKDDDQYQNPDYWTLDLPEETQDYVPKLLAISRIFAHAEDYGIDLRYIPNKPYVEMVDVHSPLDLKKAAQLAHTPYEKFKKLNPGFNRACTAPQGPHRLLVPVEKVELFKNNLASLPFHERLDINQYFYEQRMAAAEQAEDKAVREIPVATKPALSVKQSVKQNAKTVLENTISYTVKPGDTLFSIANKNHTSVGNLRSANKLGNKPIRSGMLLALPSSETQTSKPIVVATKSTPVSKSLAGNPVVQSKKINLSKYVAVTHLPSNAKTGLEKVQANSKIALSSSARKTLGKTSPPQLASSSSVRLIHYTTGKGDSLIQIAKKFNVPIGELKKSNADALAKGLRAGQKLKIFVDGQPRS